jgi:hypothetical protein
VSEDAKHKRRYSDHGESTDPDSDADFRNADGAARIDVITRAAELLREAMDIEEGGGGVLFLDTALSTTPSRETEQPVVAQGMGCQEHPPSSQGGSEAATTTGPNTRSSSPEVRRKGDGITEVLAHAFQSIDTSADQPEFEPFAPEELLKLIKRYPRSIKKGRSFPTHQRANPCTTVDRDRRDDDKDRLQTLQSSVPTSRELDRSSSHQYGTRRRVDRLLASSTTTRITATSRINLSSFTA